MKITPYVLISLGLTLASAAVGAWVYSRLPDGAVVAVHWDLHGHANGFARKGAGLAFMLALPPLTSLGRSALFVALPRLSRFGPALEKAGAARGVAMVGVAGLMLALQAIIAAQSVGVALDVVRLISGLTGALFMALGNVLGKVGRNEFFGVRTPWTLASATVWDKTQHFAGRLMVVAGALLAATSLLVKADEVLFAAIMLSALAPAIASVIYSWAIFPKAERV